jgi:CBS domain-containing protein
VKLDQWHPSFLQINEDQPVLKAFQLMREKGVGGLPVMDTNGAKAIGNISIRDVQYLLTAPKIYKEHRFVILMHLVDENPYVW